MLLPFIYAAYIILAYLSSDDSLHSSTCLVEQISTVERFVQFSFSNSTSQLLSLNFNTHTSLISRIYKCSILTVYSCCFTFFNRPNSLYPFSNSGKLVLVNISVIHTILRNPLIYCGVPDHMTEYDSLHLSNVEVTASSFLDVQLYDEGRGIVSCGWRNSERISNCKFKNVTVTEQQFVSESVSVACILEDSSISNGLEGLYGEIVTGLSHNTLSCFICSNNTFHNTIRTSGQLKKNDDGRGGGKKMQNEVLTYSSIEFLTRQYLSATFSYEFTRCTFTDCSATLSDPDKTFRGGAIGYFPSSAVDLTFTITECTFTNCTSEYSGGAAYIKNAQTCLISRCSFTNCTALNESSTSGGGLHLRSISACLSVKDCVFDNCTSGKFGGGINIVKSNVTGDECDDGNTGLVNGCTFTKCTAADPTESGGGINFETQPSSFIRSCLFTSCHASSAGGAVYWLNPPPSSATPWIYLCVFFNNSALTHGKDVYVSSTQTTTFIDSYSYTLSDQIDRVNCNGAIHDDWLPYRMTVSISPSSSSSSSVTTTCIEDLAIPCTSLSQAIAAANTFDSSIPLLITFLDGVHSSSSDDDTTFTITRSGQIMSKSEVTSAVIYEVMHQNFGISLSTHSLTLDSFTITLNVSLTSPLLTITSTGTLTLNDMIFTSSTSLTHSSSILSIGSGTLNCSSSTHISNFTLLSSPFLSLSSSDRERRISVGMIENMSRNEGNGSVIELNNFTSSITLTSSTFTSCTSLNGNGGALSLSTSTTTTTSSSSSSYSSSTLPTLTLTSLTFHSCSAHGGGAMHISVSLQNVVIDSCVFNSCTAASSNGGGGVWIVMGEGGYVSLRGGSMNGCHADTGSGGGISALLSSDASLTLSSLSFTSCTSLNGGAFYCSNTDTSTLTVTSLTLTSCNAEVGGGMNILLAGGKTKIEGGSVNGCSSDGSGGGVRISVTNAEGVVEMDGMNFTSCVSGVDGGGVYASLHTGNLTVESCLFDLCNSSGSGGGMEIESENGSVKIMNGSVSGCHAMNGSGGGISLSSTEQSLIEMEGTRFERCGSGVSGGGMEASLSSMATLSLSTLSFTECTGSVSGGIHLEVNGTPTSVLLSHIHFSSLNNTATNGTEYGNALYVTTPSLTHITPDMFPSFISSYSSLNEESKAKIGSNAPSTLADVFNITADFDEVSGEEEQLMHLSPEGADSIGCWIERIGCRTIGYSTELLPYTLSSRVAFLMKEGAYSETKMIPVNEKEVSVNGSSSLGVDGCYMTLSITDETPGAISITSGKCRLSEFSITLQTDLSDSYSIVWITNEGELKLDRVKIEGAILTMYMHPLSTPSASHTLIILTTHPFLTLTSPQSTSLTSHITSALTVNQEEESVVSEVNEFILSGGSSLISLYLSLTHTHILTDFVIPITHSYTHPH